MCGCLIHRNWKCLNLKYVRSIICGGNWYTQGNKKRIVISAICNICMLVIIISASLCNLKRRKFQYEMILYFVKGVS